MSSSIELGTFSDVLFYLERAGIDKDRAREIVTQVFCWGVDAAMVRLRHAKPAPADAPETAPQLTLVETTAPAKAAKPKREPSKGLHRMPSDFALTDDMKCFAAERAFPPAAINAMWLKFTNHYSANGQTAVDWKAKWRTWVMRTVEFNTRDGKTPGGSDTTGGGFL